MFVKRMLLCAFVIAGLIFVLTPAYSEQKFKLKLGAEGALCLNCHTGFQDKVKKPFVHTPVKSGLCTGCHNPHASTYPKFLAREVTGLCYKCHKDMVPQNARSTHEAITKGSCVKCHDPHSSDNKFNLSKSGNELCFDCHKEMGERLKGLKFRHAPVAKGCTSCHNPHGSANSASLLLDSVPGLCKNCHKTNSPIFAKQHMNYPVADARCTTCHDPHGSNRGAILYDNVHAPVANRKCNQCHDEPASAKPFSLKRPGYDLCAGCHGTLINEIFEKNRIHWPVLGKKGCLTCHNPHASKEPKLLSSSAINLCGQCHNDTIQRQARAQTKHPPIQEGLCTSCHSPHSSNNDFLFNEASIVELCGSCHDWMKHSTHPIGEKVIDPRNKNLTVQCLSCHRAHGTENKNFIYFPVITQLCVQCHAKYER